MLVVNYDASNFRITAFSLSIIEYHPDGECLSNNSVSEQSQKNMPGANFNINFDQTATTKRVDLDVRL